MNRMGHAARFIAIAALFSSGAASALTINLTFQSGTSAEAQQGFQAAAQLWEARFVDPVTVNINVGLGSVSGGALGATNAIGTFDFSYAATRSALLADSKSVQDATAVANLQAGPDMRLWFNGSLIGGVLEPAHLVTSNGFLTAGMFMTRANAKALGLLGPSAALDATITLSNLTNWDFDRSDGIAVGSFDFVGTAAHEIAHALGFESGADSVDGAFGLLEEFALPCTFNTAGALVSGGWNCFSIVNPLDLYRYSSASVGQQALDLTARLPDVFFSIDGGATQLAPFSTGQAPGDGSQPSHWRNQGVCGTEFGILDPVAVGACLQQISPLDETALDVIGWDPAQSEQVPEPSTIALLAAMAVPLGWRALRRKYRKAR